MGVSFLLELEREDWELVMDYIKTRRTHEPAFQELFEKILSDPNHAYHIQARQLKALYDFTPLRAPEEEKKEE